MIRQIIHTVLPLTCAALLSGCNQGSQETNTTDKSADVVATVNGAPITEQELDTYTVNREAAQPGAALRRQTALNDLIKLEVVKQQAEKEGVDKRPDVRAELNWQRTNVLVNTLMRERMNDMSFSDKELKAEYKKQVAQLAKREYKARHILTKTHAQAEDIIKRLNNGTDFVKLSKRESTAPSAPQGGELGWFSPDTMVPPFAQAVEKLKKGEYTKQPVKTKFGWHVILLEDSRQVQPPAYAQVKDRLRNILISRALESYIDKLRAAADIKIMPGPKAPPQTRSAPKAK